MNFMSTNQIGAGLKDFMICRVRVGYERVSVGYGNDLVDANL
jgi:hypothetical protein